MFFQLCLERSTAHGLGNIAHENHITGKVIWLVLTIIMASFFIYHTVKLAKQLQEEHILISTQKSDKDFIQPDIVFCPDRIFAKDYINNPPKDEYEYMYNVSESIQRFDKSIGWQFHNYYIWDSLNYHQLYKAFFQRKEELFLSITCNLNEVNVSSMKAEMNMMHFACYRFDSRYCKLQTPFDTLVIKFYIYNHGINDTYSKLNVLIKNKTIDTYFFRQIEPNNEMEDGINVFFTKRGEAISSIQPKVTAQINMHTNIRVKATEMERISTTKSKCDKIQKYEEIYNFLEENILDNSVNVSLFSICTEMLIQFQFYMNFNCVTTQFPITKMIPPNFNFCGNIYLCKNNDFVSNFIKNPELLNNNSNDCQEFRPCSTIVYNYIANYNHWPRRSTLLSLFKNDIYKKLFYDNVTSPGLKIAYEDFKKNPSKIDSWKINFVKVSISPAEFRSNLIKESLQYTFTNFFSDVGGIMGFYMGASVLTICEIFRLLHDFVQLKLGVKLTSQNENIPSPNVISIV